MRSRTTQASILVAVTALCITSCNAAVGAGAVVVLGGVGFLASQCYDRVQVRVIDPATGRSTCDANVTVVDAEGSERSMRPCYNTALTDGRWRITARQAGYLPASTEITIAEREGACPYYTHSVQLTLRREGEPVTVPVARDRERGSAAPPSTLTDLESPPARVVPPPIPGAPTKAFEPTSPPTVAPPVAPPAPAPPAATPPGPSAPPPTPPTPAPGN